MVYWKSSVQIFVKSLVMAYFNTMQLLNLLICCYWAFFFLSLCRSSVGPSYARTRCIVYAIIGIIFLAAGVGVTVSKTFLFNLVHTKRLCNVKEMYRHACSMTGRPQGCINIIPNLTSYILCRIQYFCVCKISQTKIIMYRTITGKFLSANIRGASKLLLCVKII